jgi:hypothetical protein
LNKTLQDRFTSAKQVRAHSLPILSSTRVVTVRVTWPKKPKAAFDVVQIRLRSRARASVEAVRPGKLKITKTRASTSVAVRMTKLKPGTLRFGVKAIRLRGPTTATVRMKRS